MSRSTTVPVSRSLAWQAVMVVGLVQVALGTAVLVWPDATLAVVVLIVGIELIIAGVMRMLVAAADPTLDARVLRALMGLVSVGVGLLVMRDPLRSLGVVVAVLGVFWVLWGLVELFLAITPEATGVRGSIAVEALVALVGGTVLLAWPEVTVLGLAILVGALLVAAGLAALWTGWRLRDAEVGGLEVISLDDQGVAPTTGRLTPPSEGGDHVRG